MAHHRELNGRVLTFGNEGALYGNAMTWWDHETESLWSQPTAEALVGELAGERLALYPSALTTWGDWQDSYPDTLALDINTRLTRSGFDLDSMVVAVEIAGTAQAFPIPKLRDQGVVNTEIQGLSTQESGTQLVRIAAFTVFRKDCSTFWPGGVIWAPDR